MREDLPIQIGVGRNAINRVNLLYHQVNRLDKILERLEVSNPIIITAKYFEKSWTKFIQEMDRVYWCSDETIQKYLKDEYAWIESIEGFGQYRIIQYLLSPTGCLIRDQDTLEMDHRLIQYQITNLGKINDSYNNYKGVYIFSDYYGRGIPQFVDGPSPLDLMKLDRMWLNPERLADHIEAARRGKFLFERFSQLRWENLGWGNHGSAAIDAEFFRTIPPIAGPIRGGDDTLPTRIVMWLEDHLNWTTVITPWQVEHVIDPYPIESTKTLAETQIIIQTILFQPYWHIISKCWKSEKKRKISELASRIAIMVKETIDFQEVLLDQKKLIKEIQGKLQILSKKYKIFEKILSEIDWNSHINSVKRIFELSLLLYEHWFAIHKENSYEISKFITSKPTI